MNAKTLTAATLLATATCMGSASAEIVLNGDFSNASQYNAIGDSTAALTDHAPAGTGWYGKGGSGSHWALTSGVMVYAKGDGTGGGLYQVIQDNKSTTGIQTFSFDIDFNSNGMDLGVNLLGWNAGDPVPESDSGNTHYNEGDQIQNTGAAGKLITTTGVDGEGTFGLLGASSAQNGLTITDDGPNTFQTVSLQADFGTGYDYISIMFYAHDLNYASGGSSVSIDNVSIVPEPGSLALLGLGGLCLLRRRRNA